MMAARVITSYALFGATAQMRYTEPVATLDADVLITVEDPERLDLLAPVYRFCKERGLEPQGDAVRIGAWPVQFVPVFSPLAEEAVREAETADFEGEPFRVVKAVHLAALALSVGRAKDFARILALLESGSVGPGELGEVAARHGLSEAWERFQRRFLDA